MALVMLAATAAAAEEIVTPSGMAVSWLETVHGAPGPEGLTARFRFLAPAIAGEVDFETAAEDMHWLCETFALPRLSVLGPQPSQVVISLADREIPFGQTDPAAVQYFEAYRPEGDACEWEMF
ncbi:DUF6497 family protein [Frigidibacter mobilis]|nr:DUF6497 family protein [Frigidibacter mobilis]